jgi:hypothetical protein
MPFRFLSSDIDFALMLLGKSEAINSSSSRATSRCATVVACSTVVKEDCPKGLFGSGKRF